MSADSRKDGRRAQTTNNLIPPPSTEVNLGPPHFCPRYKEKTLERKDNQTNNSSPKLTLQLKETHFKNSLRRQQNRLPINPRHPPKNDQTTETYSTCYPGPGKRGHICSSLHRSISRETFLRSVCHVEGLSCLLVPKSTPKKVVASNTHKHGPAGMIWWLDPLVDMVKTHTHRPFWPHPPRRQRQASARGLWTLGLAAGDCQLHQLQAQLRQHHLGSPGFGASARPFGDATLKEHPKTSRCLGGSCM